MAADALPTAAEVTAQGRYFGRFRWTVQPLEHGDWLPDPNGTHDAYHLRGSIYLVEVTP